MQSMHVSGPRFSVARRGLHGLILVSLLMIGLVVLAEAAPPAQSPDAGKSIFDQKCIACHTVGGGPLVGPDLKEVTAQRDRDWLVRWISEPDKMLAEKDPIASQLLQEYNNVLMPNLGLAKADVVAVLAYLETQAEGAAAPQPTQAAAAAAAVPAGDPAIGKALFTGAIHLSSGGPPCMSCHSVAGVGTLGGGTLGPDLTKVYTRYGAAGLSATLKSLPFPTMQGVFANQPLTDQEVADLYAYFAETDQMASQPVSSNFVGVGLGGFIVLGLLSQLIWNKRLTGVRRPLVGK